MATAQKQTDAKKDFVAITEGKAPKSKSLETKDPTIIKIPRAEFVKAVKIQDIIKEIPSECNISLCSLIITDDKIYLDEHHKGNTFGRFVKLNSCKSVYLENIISSCPTKHKANYKIIVIEK